MSTIDTTRRDNALRRVASSVRAIDPMEELDLRDALERAERELGGNDLALMRAGAITPAAAIARVLTAALDRMNDAETAPCSGCGMGGNVPW